jgi:hypothetical protein
LVHLHLCNPFKTLRLKPFFQLKKTIFNHKHQLSLKNSRVYLPHLIHALQAPWFCKKKNHKLFSTTTSVNININVDLF